MRTWKLGFDVSLIVRVQKASIEGTQSRPRRAHPPPLAAASMVPAAADTVLAAANTASAAAGMAAAGMAAAAAAASMTAVVERALRALFFKRANAMPTRKAGRVHQPGHGFGASVRRQDRATRLQSRRIAETGNWRVILVIRQKLESSETRRC